jgi:hypothetical protein
MTDRDDLTNGPPPTATEDAHTIMINRVSWGAILAGTVVALVVQVLLTMLGVGIGAATLDPVSGDNPEVSTFSMASAIWYGVSGLIAAFAGGYIAARMSGKTVPTTGALHGLTTWAVTTLLVLYLVSTSLGSIIGGTFRGIAGAVGGVGQAATEVAGPMLEDANPLEALERGVEATGTDPEALTASAVNAMRRVVMSDESGAAQARQEAAQALSEARDIPLSDAEQQVAELEQQYRQTVEQARQTATEAADAAASAVSTGALAAFVALLLGAAAGWLGGRSGVVHPVYADRLLPRRTRI